MSEELEQPAAPAVGYFLFRGKDPCLLAKAEGEFCNVGFRRVFLEVD
jgi:hypothetical protein